MNAQSSPFYRDTRFDQLAFLVWFLAFAGLLMFTTVKMRHANYDDFSFDTATQSGSMWDYSMTAAREQGRFYMPLANGFPAAVFSIKNPVLFSTVRTLFILGDAIMVGWLFARLFSSKRVGMLVALLSLLFLQIPLCYYGVFSSPQLSSGFMVSCLVFMVLAEGGRAADRKWIFVFATGFAAFLAACMNECFFLPLGIAAVLRFRASGCFNKYSLAVLVALTLYLAIYMAFRRLNPPSYGGVQMSFSPFEILKSHVRYTLATLPGVELLLNRHNFQLEERLIKSGAEIRSILTNLDLAGWLMLSSGLGIALKLFHGARHEFKQEGGLVRCLALVAIALSFNLPICLTEKYQVWSYLRQFPYFYSMCCYFLLSGVMTVFALWLYGRFVATATWRIVASHACVLVLLSVLAVSVWASNKHVIGVLHRAPYPIPDALYAEPPSASLR